MKAIFFRRHGGNEVLEYGDWPDPEPGPGEVRVALRAAALNHLDLFVRNGISHVPLPQIPGADGAGVVDASEPASRAGRRETACSCSPASTATPASSAGGASRASA